MDDCGSKLPGYIVQGKWNIHTEAATYFKSFTDSVVFLCSLCCGYYTVCSNINILLLNEAWNKPVFNTQWVYGDIACEHEIDTNKMMKHISSFMLHILWLRLQNKSLT